MSSKLNADQVENNKHLKLVMMTVRLLSKQGLAFRGKTDDDSNFNNVLDALIEVAGENVICKKIRNMHKKDLHMFYLEKSTMIP